MDKELLAMLVCPVSKSKLEYDAEAQELLCYVEGLAYPIREGIPVMLPEEARVMSADEKLRTSPGRTGEV